MMGFASLNPSYGRAGSARRVNQRGRHSLAASGIAGPMPAFHRPPASYQQRRTLRHPRQSQTRRYRHGTSVSIEVAADAFAIGAPLAGAADAPGVSPTPNPITARMTKASSVLFIASSMRCQGTEASQRYQIADGNRLDRGPTRIPPRQ